MQPTDLMLYDWVRNNDGSFQLTQPHELEHADSYKPVPLSEFFFRINKFRLKSETDEDGIHVRQYRRSVSGVYTITVYQRSTNGCPDEFVLSINRRGSRRHRYNGNIDKVHELQHHLRDCDLIELANNLTVKDYDNRKNNPA